MLLFTVSWRSAGALAVIVTTPGVMQVAVPVLSMVAIAVFDDFHVRPSATVSVRLVLLSNVPVALYPTVPCGELVVVAVAGLTAMLINFG